MVELDENIPLIFLFVIGACAWVVLLTLCVRNTSRALNELEQPPTQTSPASNNQWPALVPSTAAIELTPNTTSTITTQLDTVSSQLDRYFEHTTGTLHPEVINSAPPTADWEQDTNNAERNRMFSRGWIGMQFNKGIEKMASYYETLSPSKSTLSRLTSGRATRTEVDVTPQPSPVVGAIGEGSGSALLERRRSRWWRVGGAGKITMADGGAMMV